MLSVIKLFHGLEMATILLFALSRLPSNAAQAPTFSQGSYSFTITNCNAGTSIGQVSATSSTPITYSTDNSFVIAANSQTGMLSLGATVAAGLTFNVIAKNPYGTAQVSVTVTAACGGVASPTAAPYAFPYYGNNYIPLNYPIPLNGFGSNLGFPYNLGNQNNFGLLGGSGGFPYYGNSGYYRNGIGNCYNNRCYYDSSNYDNNNNYNNNNNNNNNLVCFNGACFSTNFG